MKDLIKLKELDHEIYLLSHGIALLQWDQETYMPESAVNERSEQIALFEGILHNKLTDSIWGELFANLSVDDHSIPEKFNNNDNAFLREAYRRYRRKIKLPVELIKEFSAEVSISQSKWIKAKKEDNFSIFAPHLEKIIDFSRKIADLVGYTEHPYDALLDEYEPWMRSSGIKSVFDKLEPGLRSLIGRIKNAPQIDSSFLDHNFPVELQNQFGKKMQKEMGYDFERGRLDLTVHPFSTTLGYNDVRITTHYNKNDLLSGIFSNIHEAGHGQYEQGFGEDIQGSLLANGTSMGIHESQSRFWENLIGRDINYWANYYPELVKIFPDQLKYVSMKDFYKAVNKVEPSVIRIEADEVTYSMHIILRFRLELALISGDLSVKDLPDAWVAESEKLLGVKSDSYSNGVLQDIHWSAGLFGYFPTYALGNLYNAQFTNIMKSDITDFNLCLQKGELAPIKNWLREKIHRFGSSVSATDLIKNISGESLNPDYFLKYLEGKYKTIYDI
ncbi:MAG: carboxypeptidase M32 [Candidatus Cloacimonetes bacterium]|jgi:carboxypeptidase Taq|nr:carboxypeptidase M32 [Candidatus Cloacimonadota bacterium]